MAAMAPARASASIASCQVVHKPPAVKDARVAKMSALSSSMNGVLARDSAGRREASGSRGQVRCALAGEVHTRDQDDVRTYKGFERPDSFGRYGVYGGKYVPETLMAALSNLEVAYRATIKDPEFQVRTDPSPSFLNHLLSFSLRYMDVKVVVLMELCLDPTEGAECYTQGLCRQGNSSVLCRTAN
jgi:hypothetical protein